MVLYNKKIWTYARLLTIAKIWKQFKCSRMEKWIREFGIFIQWNVIQPLNRHDGHGGHYAK